MVRHGILAPRLPGSNPGTLVSGRFFCSLCFSSPAGTMMLHAICIVHLLSNTPLVESWLKIRHKDRRGLLEHLSHDAQACKSTYAFWHERSRNRRCHFIQNPPLIIVCFWVASAWGVRYSCRRKDGSNPSLPLSGTGFIPVTGWSYWKTGGRRLELPVGGFRSFTPT